MYPRDRLNLHEPIQRYLPIGVKEDMEWMATVLIDTVMIDTVLIDTVQRDKEAVIAAVKAIDQQQSPDIVTHREEREADPGLHTERSPREPQQRSRGPSQ